MPLRSRNFKYIRWPFIQVTKKPTEIGTLRNAKKAGRCNLKVYDFRFNCLSFEDTSLANKS